MEAARTVGVSREIEMVSEEPSAPRTTSLTRCASCCQPERFPWAIWSVEHWALYADLEEFAWKFDWD